MLTKHATHAQARAATLAEAVLLRDAKLLLDRESVGADARACGDGVGEEGRVGIKAEKPVAAATGSAEFPALDDFDLLPKEDGIWNAAGLAVGEAPEESSGPLARWCVGHGNNMRWAAAGVRVRE